MDTFRIISSATVTPSIISRPLPSKRQAMEGAVLLNKLGHSCYVVPEAKAAGLPLFAQGWRESQEALDFLDETKDLDLETIRGFLKKCRP